MSSSRKNNDDPWSSSDEDDDDDDDDLLDNDGEDDDDDRFTFRSICSYSHNHPSSSDSSPTFDTLASALEYDVAHYGFNLLGHLPPSSDEDDFFECAIVLVNKCRQFVKDKENEEKKLDEMELGKQLNDYVKTTQGKEDDDDEDDVAYYKPVMEDDAMLMCIDELQELKRKGEIESTQNGSEEDNATEATGTTKENSETIHKLQSQVSLLEKELSRAKALIGTLANDDDDAMSDGSCSSNEEEKAPPNKTEKKKRRKKKKSPVVDTDSYYFTSYSNTGIHETMLRDTVRTAAYEEAILSNAKPLFRNKVVMDIGCGTGVLSLFCAKAGAKKVIAVDNSDILNQAERIVKLNGFENVVTCVRGKIESLIETKGLPLDDGETVDIIVSEWMGYALFFETMLPSVMAARDALMTPTTGSMFPNVSKIFIEGANGSQRLNYWDNVHSLNMAPMKERMVAELTDEAWVEVVDDAKIVTNRAMLIEHNLNTCKDEELDFEAPFELHLRNHAGGLSQQPPSSANQDDAVVPIHHLVISFDINFSVPDTNVVSFSTGCQSTPTHWKQTVLWFDPMHNCPGLNVRDGDVMRGTFRMKRNAENHRAIDMAVSWETGHIREDSSWARLADGVLKRSLIA
mmetsp:Transcript_28627/g.48713  ORF Transcript_28627/g.48713 Transcript_28627/m.48713 type:complete len:628 (+) Transcript_28627:108-1991(+)|eukprot:CAMPEP_0183769112 /NCGR_PEP_ID=MMETSP0739-20130205/20806_1 /TAXON_ID=385413 /ORGANISM="Thalassiosira miniscula, Strain CCMP1093" /LENGTH=627 /DNA_ID=CAMNT_0026008625 /DNA_START=85 /DNA_END=1968 /DNA_ORIENTATION=+